MGFSVNIILHVTSDNALHDITPAVLPRARQLRRASGNFLFINHQFGAKHCDFLVFGTLLGRPQIFHIFGVMCATLTGAFVPYKPIAWPNQHYHLIEHALM